MKTITGETIKATPNHSEKTFTIRKTYKDGSKTKYRTYPMSKDDFNDCLMNTANDWNHFLKSDDYYKV